MQKQKEEEMKYRKVTEEKQHKEEAEQRRRVGVDLNIWHKLLERRTNEFKFYSFHVWIVQSSLAVSFHACKQEFIHQSFVLL